MNDADSYTDKNVEWNTDIHLMATYAFLTDDESKQFTTNKISFKEIHEYNFDNITGAKKINLKHLLWLQVGCFICNAMMFFREMNGVTFQTGITKQNLIK